MERAVGDRIVRIDRAEYAGALPVDKHVFLVGDLRRPTSHPFVRDARVELIVVDYVAGDDGAAHWHPDVTEYELVLEGEIGYFEVATGTTHWFAPGDLVAIPPRACVRRVVRRAARGLAVKVPSSAGKVHCDACARACAWRVAPCAGGGLA
jgi:hypothetical protein